MKRVITVTNPDYEVVMFSNTDGSMDVVISEKQGREAIHAKIPAPPVGTRVAVIRGAGGAIDIGYEAVASVGNLDDGEEYVHDGC